MHRKITKVITLIVTVVYITLHILDAFHITDARVEHSWPPVAALLLCFVYFAVTEALEEMEKLSARSAFVEEMFRKNKLEGIAQLFHKMEDDPDRPLNRLKAEHGIRVLKQLEDALESDDITIDSLEDFCTLYVETLNNAHSGASFFATSLPYVRYFWRPANMEAIRDAMHRHQKRGGKMERIFILKDSGEIDDPEVKQTLEAQDAFGVRVRVSYRKDVSTKDARELFLLCKDWRKGHDGKMQSIAWTLKVDPVSDTFLQARATTRQQTVDELHRRYIGLRNAHSIAYESPKVAALAEPDRSNAELGP